MTPTTVRLAGNLPLRLVSGQREHAISDDLLNLCARQARPDAPVMLELIPRRRR